MKRWHSNALVSLMVVSVMPAALAAPCSFDGGKDCRLFVDILNDRAADGLRYYGATNFDHRVSGEINVFDANLVQPYTDGVNAPGQLKLIANRTGNPAFRAGEIMTRVNLDRPPYNSPTRIYPFTTNDIQHGYIEAVIKLPKCEVSDDGLCQRGANPQEYNRGLWPSVWLLPTFDNNWPQNGEIDVWEAYQLGRGFNVTTATLHFAGNDPRCGGNDCRGIGYHLAVPAAGAPLYNGFHRWGFEWEPDPRSKRGGVIMTGYFDNARVWGPLASDSLPADGPAAFARGFHDPAGGFYVIAALAVGGPYSGAPNGHLQSTTMYVQSIKAYAVGGGNTPPTPPPTGQCKAPVNIQATVTANKKQATITWQAPANAEAVKTYQVNDWQNRQLWIGPKPPYVDKSLPGKAGKYTYFMLSNCASGPSPKVQYDLIIK